MHTLSFKKNSFCLIINLFPANSVVVNHYGTHSVQLINYLQQDLKTFTQILLTSTPEKLII